MSAPTLRPVAAPATPPAPPTAPVLRLRPVVHAAPTAAGLHVRGWTSSFTVDGGEGLWTLWRAVTAQLAGGATEQQLLDLSRRDATRAAVATLLVQLREHDMVVAVAPGWGGGRRPDDRTAAWLEAAAPDPVAAWARLRAATVTVTGRGRLAAAAARALAAAGVGVRRCDGGDRGRVVIEAAGTSVRAAADGDAGLAGAPDGGPAAFAAQVARAGVVEPAGADAETPVLAALVGGVAAHRLLCAVAGLPDPGVDGGAPPVFVARLDPLRGGYHPWAGEPAAADPDAPGRLDRALALADVLTDVELGPLPPVRVVDLPQVPAGLAAVTAPAGTAFGVGATVDVARLGAVLGAVEQATPGVTAGADRRHADGLALRRLAHRRRGAGRPLGERSWSGSPVARQWWKTLTLRQGVPARIAVTRLADGIHHAAVSDGDTLLGWGVEADPADAVTFALLTAVGAGQWRDVAGADPAAVLFPPCGATPSPELPDPGRVPWQAGAWTWPSPLAAAEFGLQSRLRSLLGVTPVPAGPAGPCSLVVLR